MADPYNENDELSQVIQWLKANGVALIVGALLGLGVIAGWQWWQAYTAGQARQAASLYGDVVVQIERGQLTDEALAEIERLKTEYAGSPYAANAALQLAAYYVGQSQFDKAIAQLEWGTGNAEDSGMRHLARVRQARVLWAQGQADAALALLATEHPDPFNRLYAELAGDIYAAQGDRAAAHAAYQRAAEARPANDGGQVLARKLANTAPVESDTRPESAAAEAVTAKKAKSAS